MMLHTAATALAAVAMTCAIVLLHLTSCLLITGLLYALKGHLPIVDLPFNQQKIIDIFQGGYYNRACKGGDTLSIGVRIKEIRKFSGLTQQKFAEKIGLKRNTIGNYEIDLIYPSDRTIVDICRTFNVNETWLRTGEGEMFRQDEGSVVDRLCAELHADELEAEIIRAYFRIDERIRLPFLRRLIQEVQERPAEPDTTGQERTVADAGGQERTELDLAAKVAELERQNQEKDKQLQELSEKVAAMEEEDALLGLTDGFSTSPSESVGKFNAAEKAKI